MCTEIDHRSKVEGKRKRFGSRLQKFFERIRREREGR
jgi:hypothetical protein